MTKTVLTALLAVVLALPALAASTGISPRMLEQDFARLDRAYIPALALTSAEQAAPSARAMRILREEWNLFKGTWQASNPGDAAWRDDFNIVEEHILAAERIVASGRELVKAHEELEHVRMVFLNLRSRNGMAYYLDNLTRFHDNMEAIVLTVKGKAPAQLGAKELEKIRAHLALATGEWRTVRAAALNRQLFGFNDRKLARLNANLLAESQALDTLGQKLEAGDRAAIIRAGVAIKPPFATIFKLFGDFDRVN